MVGSYSSLHAAINEIKPERCIILAVAVIDNSSRKHLSIHPNRYAEPPHVVVSEISSHEGHLQKRYEYVTSIGLRKLHEYVTIGYIRERYERVTIVSHLRKQYYEYVTKIDHLRTRFDHAIVQLRYHANTSQLLRFMLCKSCIHFPFSILYCKHGL